MAITSLYFYFGQFTLKSTHVCQIETSVYTVKCTNVLTWINIWYFKPKKKKRKFTLLRERKWVQWNQRISHKGIATDLSVRGSNGTFRAPTASCNTSGLAQWATPPAFPFNTWTTQVFFGLFLLLWRSQKMILGIFLKPEMFVAIGFLFFWASTVSRLKNCRSHGH